jgi:hypothetical protein
MKKHCRIFPYQLIHDDNLKDMRNESFERGFNSAKRESIEFLTDKQKYDCKTLTKKEKSMIMDFLEKHNFQFGYDVSNGGFYVLKTK